MTDDIQRVTGETQRRSSEKWAGQINLRLDAATLRDLRKLTAQRAWPENTPQAVIRELIRKEAATQVEEAERRGLEP